jgi:arylsulfatase
MDRPNILFVMTDQQRYDTIAALGNPLIWTPNYDRLVRRGVSFTNAYSSCPVCVPTASPRTWRSAAGPSSRGG